MKVVHVNTNDIVDGTGRAAYRLHSGLRRLGHDSLMFVFERRSLDSTVISYKPPGDPYARLTRRVRRERIRRDYAAYRKSRPTGYERFSDDRSPHRSTLLDQLPNSDLINLHSVADFVDFGSFHTQVSQHTPIVWTLHDMKPFTGGCHYDHGCSRYRDRCGACPQLGSNDLTDLSNDIWNRKNRIFRQIGPEGMHIVALSNWMKSEVKRSELMDGFPITLIPNSVDIDDFAPRDREFSRETLGIPLDAKVVLFIASRVNTQRKGFRLLSKALFQLREMPNLHLISLGEGAPALEFGIPHVHLGSVHNDRLLSLIFSAADLLAVSSLQDNLPNTVLESMSCGTPIVAFSVGGIPDMVQAGVTGRLVPSQDTVAMSKAIGELLENDPVRLEMSANCRKVAIDEYSLEVQAGRYAKLYDEIIDRNRRDLI